MKLTNITKRIIGKIIIMVITLSISFGTFSNLVLAQAMTSGTYQIQIDSVNFAGGRSSSNTYNIEDTAGEIATGDSQSNSYALSAGYEQADEEADLTPPTVPTNLVATAAGTSQINLSWTASTDDTGVSGYRIRRDGSIIASTTLTSYSDSPLTSNTSYTYTVEAFDGVPRYSGESTRASATTSEETVDEEEPGRGGSSGSIPSPTPGLISLIIEGSIPNIVNLVATPDIKNKSINLTWSNPKDFNFDSIRIVKSDVFFPTNPNEGLIIFDGKAEQFVDRQVKENKTYYYSLFVRDSEGKYSSGALAIGLLNTRGGIVLVDPFDGIKIGREVHPIIAKLTLKDFDFIQDGRKIENDGETIAIDGSKNLTILLDYKKVPEVLKTIAFSLSDPEDPTKIFPFLLRVNKDKNAYEATIAPLGRDGDYKLNIVILDYKNQGLKKLAGNLKAFVFDSVGDIILADKIKLGDKKVSFNWLWLVLAVLLVIVFLIIKRKKHEVQ
jgi:hypothetical protein